MSLRRSFVAAVSAAAVAVPVILPATADAARYGTRTLRQGSSGSDVTALQRYIRRAGVRISADGDFGRGTARAFRRIERQLEFRVDGRATPREQRALRSSISIPMGGGATYVPPPDPNVTVPGEKAKLTSDGFAIAPASAPAAVKKIIAAGNKIAKTPYKWGGGHGEWRDTGYDCSGSVSYALHGAGFLRSALVSGDFPNWGDPGRGTWVTIRGNSGHVYMVVAGLRFDTSARKSGGSRWTTQMRSPRGYRASHPPAL